jgi:DNA-directed RNA polymerase I, II, and III subunit RPABC1
MSNNQQSEIRRPSEGKQEVDESQLNTKITIPELEDPNKIIITELYKSFISLLYKVKKTQIEMLRDRGFIIDKEELDILNMTTQEFVNYNKSRSNPKDPNKTFKRVLSRQYYKPTGEYIYVFYPETAEDSQTLQMDQVRQLFHIVLEKNGESDEINHIIIISEYVLTGDLKSIIDGLPSINIETFIYLELSFNVTKHSYVPKHSLLTKNEKIEFLRKNPNAQLPKLPIISMRDPVARYFGGQPGDIMKIIRKNITYQALVNTYVTYRVVRDSILETKSK